MAQKNFYIDGALAGQSGHVEINQDLHLNGTLKLNGIDLFVSEGTFASSGATAMGISDLADVDMSNASNGDALVYNASTQSFELASVSGSSSSSSSGSNNLPLRGLVDVNAGSPNDGDIIQYDSANSKWSSVAPTINSLSSRLYTRPESAPGGYEEPFQDALMYWDVDTSTQPHDDGARWRYRSTKWTMIKGLEIDNNSDGKFLKWDNGNDKFVWEARRTQIMGFVKFNNGFPTWHGDSGVSVSCTGPGDYRVTFSTGYSDVDDYMVMLSHQQSNKQSMVTVSKSTGYVDFHVYDESTGNAVNTGELVLTITNL